MCHASPTGCRMAQITHQTTIPSPTPVTIANATTQIDDDFKEALVPFFGVEDVDSLPEDVENFDVNEICNVEDSTSAFAMDRSAQIEALAKIVPNDVGADGTSRVSNQKTIPVLFIHCNLTLHSSNRHHNHE